MSQRLSRSDILLICRLFHQSSAKCCQIFIYEDALRLGATLAAAEAFRNNSNNFTDFGRTLFYLIFVERCLNCTSSLAAILLSRRRPLSKKTVSILLFFFSSFLFAPLHCECYYYWAISVS